MTEEQDGIPPVKKPMGPQVLLVGVLALLAIVPAVMNSLEQKTRSDNERAARAALDRLVAESAGRGEPCSEVSRIRQRIRASRIGVVEQHMQNQATLRSLQAARRLERDAAHACCRTRVTTAWQKLAELGGGDPAAPRAAGVATLAESFAADERGAGVLAACGAQDLVSQLASVGALERDLESPGDPRWQAAARVIREVSAWHDVYARLYPEPRETVLAGWCVSGALAAGDQQTDARNDAGTVQSYETAVACAEAVPAAVADPRALRQARSRLDAARRRIGAAERRDERARAAVAAAAAAESRRSSDGEAARMRALAQRCMSDCIDNGNSGFDCSADCARRYPALGQWAAEHAY